MNSAFAVVETQQFPAPTSLRGLRQTVIGAISALALVQLVTPAFAQPNDLTDQRIVHLMKQFAAKGASPAAATLVSRAATVTVQGTIRRTSPIKLPLACTVLLSDDGDNSEAKTVPVTFSNGIGTCTVAIPFKWANTDPDGTLNVFVTVTNDSSNLLLATSTVAGSDILRTSELGLPAIPLPAQGTTTQLSFDIRM